MEKHTYQLIYKSLREHDRTITEQKFSTDYLNRSHHYISMCKSKHRDISESSKLSLYKNLRQNGLIWKDIEKNDGYTFTTRFTENRQLFENLAELIIKDILH